MGEERPHLPVPQRSPARKPGKHVVLPLLAQKPIPPSSNPYLTHLYPTNPFSTPRHLPDKTSHYPRQIPDILPTPQRKKALITNTITTNLSHPSTKSTKKPKPTSPRAPVHGPTPPAAQGLPTVGSAAPAPYRSGSGRPSPAPASPACSAQSPAPHPHRPSRPPWL